MYPSLRSALVATVAIVSVGVGCNNCFTGPKLTIIPLSIAAHASTLLPKVEADQSAQRASQLLQVEDWAGDVACSVGFTIDSLTATETGNGVVDSQLTFDELFAGVNAGDPAMWHVRVVSEIHWCDGPVASVGGCADLFPGRRVVVARRAPLVEGILWAHEVGHTKGLSHRTDNWVLLMHPTILPDHHEVDAAECTKYRQQ